MPTPSKPVLSIDLRKQLYISDLLEFLNGFGAILLKYESLDLMNLFKNMTSFLVLYQLAVLGETTAGVGYCMFNFRFFYTRFVSTDPYTKIFEGFTNLHERR